MSKRRPTKQQKTRQNTGVDLGAAYGLIAGAALGVLAYAFTGDILWMVFGSGIGLPLGLAIGSTVARRRDPDHTGQQVSDESR